LHGSYYFAESTPQPRIPTFQAKLVGEWGVVEKTLLDLKGHMSEKRGQHREKNDTQHLNFFKT
jgi:hypothetical protein